MSLVLRAGSAYDAAVLADGPVGFWPASAGTAMMPNGDAATLLDGASQWTAVHDAGSYSVPTTGALTVEVWLRPDVLDFPGAETSADGPLVYPLIKGTTYGTGGDQEWALRMYGRGSATRPNRISGYVFNPDGGLGAGSYFQDALTAGQWMHIALVVDTVTKGADGWGTTRIYRDGALRDTDTLGGTYRIAPVNNGAPVHIGARPGRSYFKGAIGKVALYGRALTSAQIAAHFAAMYPA